MVTDVIINKAKKLKSEMQVLVFDVFFENAEVLEGYNRDQLRQGFRADGVPLPNYSPASVNFFGKRPGRITLHDTGAFYRGFLLDADPDEAFLIGTDEKTDMLEERYGEDILGISEENKERFNREVLLPKLQEGLKRFFDE